MVLLFKPSPVLRLNFISTFANLNYKLFRYVLSNLCYYVQVAPYADTTCFVRQAIVMF